MPGLRGVVVNRRVRVQKLVVAWNISSQGFGGRKWLRN
jgi:hypothetical protein